MVPFLVPKEEQLVLLDRAADGIAPVIAAELVFTVQGQSFAGVARGEIAVRRKAVVAPGVESTSVKIIGATAGNNADDSTRRLPVFRAIAIGEHLEFGDRLVRGINQDGAV